MQTLIKLFLTFAKIGAFTFGGGYAMLPIMQRECIGRGWLDGEEVADYFAMGQCLPGMIAVNTTVFIGHRVAGKAGGIAACFGLVMPSFIFITLVAAVLQNFLQYPVVQRALFGIQVVVCALIAQAIIRLWKSAIKDAFGLVVYLITLAMILLVSPPIFVLIPAALGVGIAFDTLKRRRAEEGER